MSKQICPTPVLSNLHGKVFVWWDVCRICVRIWCCSARVVWFSRKSIHRVVLRFRAAALLKLDTNARSVMHSCWHDTALCSRTLGVNLTASQHVCCQKLMWPISEWLVTSLWIRFIGTISWANHHPHHLRSTRNWYWFTTIQCLAVHACRGQMRKISLLSDTPNSIDHIIHYVLQSLELIVSKLSRC